MSADALRRPLAHDEFVDFRDLIHDRSGIWLEDSKADALRDALLARATVLELSEYEPYRAVLASRADEFAALMNIVTINETSFFRFAEQFGALRDFVVPELSAAEGPGAGDLSVWSAGCSTGEEVYSIAITLLETLGDAEAPAWSVLGTDVSTDALERARTALYPGKALSNVPEAVRRRWFVPAGDRWTLAPEVRRRCEFREHNLTEPPPSHGAGSGWSLVFCRNVTIYFRPETTRRIVERFYEAMRPGGYLFLGHSETLASHQTRFETVEAGGVYVYRKPREGVPATRARLTARGSSRPPRAQPTIARTLDRGPGSGPASSERAPLATVTPGAQGHSGLTMAAQAHRLLEEARPAEALALAAQALAADPGDTEAQLVVAFAHADLGELQTAAEEASRILHDDPLVAAASYLLGAISRDQGRTDEAAGHFRRTLCADSGFVLAHFALAGIFHQAGDLENAAREYENTLRALSRRPEGAWTAFLGGFRSELLAASCERGLAECGRFTPAKGVPSIRR